MENGEPKQVICFAGFELDAAHRRLAREGKTVTLNAKAFDLLVFLAENVGRVVTKDEILDAVWDGQFVEEANLTVQMSALRKALGENKNAPRFLVTIPGKGYKFVAEIENAPNEIIIEKHKVSRLVVDEDFEEIQPSETKHLTEGKKSYRRRNFVFAGLALLIVLGFIGYKYILPPNTPKASINSLAVLPFVNQTGDGNIEYLSDGLADSVTYLISGFPNLRVMSRNSAFRYKGKDTDARTVGRELNVEAILTGRVWRLGDNLSVSAELVSTNDNAVIWGEQFTRKMSDVGTLQNDIAQSISQKLRLKISGADERKLKNIQSTDPEAYRLYLLGRYHLNQLTDEGFEKARQFFEQAIEKDPNYAPAYAGLATVYNHLCGYNALAPNEGFPKARAAAEKAIELDDQLAEAYATLGAVKHFYDWDFNGAEKAFKRALEINPNDSDAHQFYSYYLSAMGRFDEALAEMREANRLDPLSLEKNTGIGEVFYFQRRHDQAIEQYRKALEMEPNSGFVHWDIGRVYMEKGMYSEAIAELQKSIPLSGSSPDEAVELGRAYAKSGKRAEALKILNDVNRLAERKYISSTVIASLYAALGDKEQAFALLEKAYKERDFLLVLLKIEPIFDPLRSDPRFTELVKRVGLPQ